MAYELRGDCARDAMHHVREKPARLRLESVSLDEHNHYLFLYAVSSKCLKCVHFWLHSGADLNRGTEHHADWTPLAWAKSSKAGSDITNLVTPACASEAGAEHNVLDVGHLVGKRAASSAAVAVVVRV